MIYNIHILFYAYIVCGNYLWMIFSWFMLNRILGLGLEDTKNKMRTVYVSVNINTPHIKGKIKGYLRKSFLKELKKEFGDGITFEKIIEIEKVAPLTVHERLRRYRIFKGYTQQELGRKVKVSEQFICDLEKGIEPISVKMAIKFAKIFKTTYTFFYE